MEPYVPSQGPAKWLSYLDYLAETSTWVKSVQPEHWKVVFSGRVVCSPHLSVPVVSGQQLICKRCPKHQIKCKLKVEYPVWRGEGVVWVYCKPLGCKVWELLVFVAKWRKGGSPSLLEISSYQFSRAFLENMSFDSSCCERVDPQTSLLSQLLSIITLFLVKIVTSLYVHYLGVVTKRGVSSVCAAGLSYVILTPRSRELQKIFTWSLVLF